MDPVVEPLTTADLDRLEHGLDLMKLTRGDMRRLIALVRQEKARADAAEARLARATPLSEPQK